MDRALDEQIKVIHRIRDAGWDSLWTGHHYLTDESIQLAPVVFLARIAAEAGEMTVGLAVMLLALVNPVEAAEVASSLDIACSGRFILGVGLGYRSIEHDAFAITSQQAVRRFNRNLQIVTSLLEGQEVSVDLPWCRLDKVRLRLRPIQAPRPPIWVGANADAAVLRAARLGDAWLVNPHASIDTVSRQLEFYREERARCNPGQSEIPVMREIFCAKSRAQAEEITERYLKQKYRTYQAWGQGEALPSDDTLDLPFHKLQERRFIVGTPDDCIEGLKEWVEIGASYFLLRTHWSGLPQDEANKSLELLCEEVLPSVRSH